jgi:tripartite ATP-independent transporter DctM subunit
MSTEAGLQFDAGSADAAARPEPPALRALNLAADALVVLALLGELIVVLANVFARLWLEHSFLWADEVAKLNLSVLAFVGGAVAYRRRHHAYVQVVIKLLPARFQPMCFALGDVLVLFATGLTLVASWEFLAMSWNERTPILQLPAAIIGAPLPFGLLLLMFYALLHLWRAHGVFALKVAGALAVVLVAAAITHDNWLPLFTGDWPIAVALTLFFAAILGGVPVGFVLLLATALYIWTSGGDSFAVIPQSMVNGTGNFILLAIPFFILAGLIMERGGISLRLIRFVQTLVGHLRGGLLQVAVVSMYIVSGLSGSKPADVAAVGTVMRDRLRERHGEAEGAAVLAASAIMGETVPPSIAMLIVGSITNVSVAAMFVGGLIPAAVMAIALMTLIYLRARRSAEVPGPRAPGREIVRAGLGAILPLLMPGMLLGGILAGVATPTEVAAFAVVYGLILSMVVYREMDVAGLLRAVVDTAVLTGVLLFIFAAATGFSWTLTVAYLPQRMVELLHTFGNSTAVFMVGSIALLIIIGVLLEGLPSLNVLAPLLIPIAGKLGMSEMHYALVLIIAMGVGGFMPLAGVGFYVCCAVMRSNVEAASRAMLPYLVMVLVGLLIVAFVPSLALFLPRQFGLRV